MRTYLSFGGGVNSVAMVLLGIRDGWYQDCEAVFVHHGTDYPETYQYTAMFQWWLKASGYRSITILRPVVKGISVLYDYYWSKSILPSIISRHCTGDFKIKPLHRYYYKKPCFDLIGIDTDEVHRAKISSASGVEHRWPLIEADMGRDACKRLIRDFGLPIPVKSGCFICPFQTRKQWRAQRIYHPDLWCNSLAIEKRAVDAKRGRCGIIRKNDYLSKYSMPLEGVVQENQRVLFEELEYPPCQCGL